MIRAVICDIYGTLLEVGPPPPDAEARWRSLWHQSIGTPNPPSLNALDDAVQRQVPAHHAAGRARGLQQPEIDWPNLAETAIPDLRHLSPTNRADFYYLHACLRRSTRLAHCAATCLRACQSSGRVLGIASNSQACTRRELAVALAAEHLDLSLFDSSACFWSYEQGLAKPDPGVFTTLTRHLALQHIQPHEILMVGDRADADISPALHAGWSAWHLRPAPGEYAGPWVALHQWLHSLPAVIP